MFKNILPLEKSDRNAILKKKSITKKTPLCDSVSSSAFLLMDFCISHPFIISTGLLLSSC